MIALSNAKQVRKPVRSEEQNQMINTKEGISMKKQSIVALVVLSSMVFAGDTISSEKRFEDITSTLSDRFLKVSSDSEIEISCDGDIASVSFELRNDQCQMKWFRGQSADYYTLFSHSGTHDDSNPDSVTTVMTFTAKGEYERDIETFELTKLQLSDSDVSTYTFSEENRGLIYHLIDAQDSTNVVTVEKDCSDNYEY